MAPFPFPSVHVKDSIGLDWIGVVCVSFRLFAILGWPVGMICIAGLDRVM